MAWTDYATAYERGRRFEARLDGLAVGRQVLGVRQRHDALAHLRQCRAVVLDDLLRAQERRRREPGRIAGLPAGGQHVVAAGEVVAEAHRRVRADEDGAGVHERRRVGISEVQLEVLGRVRVAERGRRREIVDQDDGRLRAGQGDGDALRVTGRAARGAISARHGGGERDGGGHQHRGGLLVVLGLADQVGRDQARVGACRRRR